MSDSKIQVIVSNGFLAAIYVVLTIVNPLSFGLIQLRIAEIFCILCFFRKDFVVGITIGCVISNLNSTLGIWDVLIGGGATLLACLFMAFLAPKLTIGCIVLVLINTVLVGFEIYYFLDVNLLLSFISIFISESICMIIGFIVLKLINKKGSFLKIINANQHLDWKW